MQVSIIIKQIASSYTIPNAKIMQVVAVKIARMTDLNKYLKAY